jgi:hypothetical protein
MLPAGGTPVDDPDTGQAGPPDPRDGPDEKPRPVRRRRVSARRSLARRCARRSARSPDCRRARTSRPSRPVETTPRPGDRAFHRFVRSRDSTNDRQHTPRLVAGTTTANVGTQHPVSVGTGQPHPAANPPPSSCCAGGCGPPDAAMARSHGSRLPNRALSGSKAPTGGGLAARVLASLRAAPTCMIRPRTRRPGPSNVVLRPSMLIRATCRVGDGRRT